MIHAIKEQQQGEGALARVSQRRIREGPWGREGLCKGPGAGKGLAVNSELELVKIREQWGWKSW